MNLRDLPVSHKNVNPVTVYCDRYFYDIFINVHKNDNLL